MSAMPATQPLEIPPGGEAITMRGGRLEVPARPIIPFIEGDGTGPDIWAASERVFDAAVQKAYGDKKKISWFEVFAGQSAKDAVELADIFARMMRRRIQDHFRALRSNDDVRKYRTARRILEGGHLWLESGLVPGEELEKMAVSAYAHEEELAAAP